MTSGPHALVSSKPEGSWEDVYRDHADLVARWAARLGGPGFDADDAVQDVFLLVNDLLPRFRGEARFTTWLYRITENVVRQRRRRDRLRRIFIRDVDLEERASQRPTPIEELERREAQRRVYRALDALPDKQRTAMILFELEGMTAEEIGELTGQSSNSVWVMLHRARKQFLAQLARSQGEGHR
jgi:RNA polymerase sigma-70 factor, ECF subfamily